jgi:hypothetical protein
VKIDRVHHGQQGLAAACTFEVGIDEFPRVPKKSSLSEPTLRPSRGLLAARNVDQLATSGIETP